MKEVITLKMARIFMLTAALGLFLGTAPAPGAQSPEAFYRGKTILLYTGSVGGSADALCRALVPFLQKETGAKVIVANHPGGNSMQTINLAYRRKPDGLVLLVHETSGIILSDWFHDPGAVWKAARFSWIARLAFQPGIAVVSPRTAYRSIDDLRKAKGLKLGASTPMGYYGPVNSLYASILNLDAKVITGLNGTSAIILSIQKGEIDGGTLSEDRAARSAKGNQVRPLFVVSGKSALFPNLPVLSNRVKLSQDQELLLDAVATVNKAVVTTPGVPKDRVNFLRKIFAKINQNKAIQETILKKTGIAGWYGFVPGEVAQKNMSDPTIGPRVKRSLQAILDKYLVR